MFNLLAIDCGNTFVKWGLHDGDSWITKHKVSWNEIDSLHSKFLNISKPSHIYISFVARDDLKIYIDKLIFSWQVDVHWIVSRSTQCHVTNSYVNPVQLGCDRWAALIASWSRLREACLVINVGTAMTVDVLTNEGIFYGGIILPGVFSMQNCLLSNTQLIYSQEGQFYDFPRSTEDGLTSGTIHALIGAIERMHNLMAVRLKIPINQCVISGGGACQIIPFLRLSYIWIEDSVLEGLVVIAKDDILNTQL